MGDPPGGRSIKNLLGIGVQRITEYIEELPPLLITLPKKTKQVKKETDDVSVQGHGTSDVLVAAQGIVRMGAWKRQLQHTSTTET